MGNNIDSKEFVGVTSVLARLKSGTKTSVYAEVAAAMKAGESIPGVEYRGTPGNPGWQIHIGGERALEDFCISRGHIFPYREAIQKNVRGEEIVSDKSVPGERVCGGSLAGELFSNIYSDSETLPPPKTHLLNGVSVQDNLEGIERLVKDLQTFPEGSVVSVTELNGKYCLTRDQIGKIVVSGSAGFSEDRLKWGYSPVVIAEAMASLLATGIPSPSLPHIDTQESVF